MHVVVCLKAVPEVADAELEIDGSEIDTDDLVFTINEWDNYALEEAIRICEAHGGKVTAVGLGDEETEDVLRRALAMGAHAAVCIDGDDFEGADATGIASALAAAIRELEPFDLVLTGAQSSDTGWGLVGGMIAEGLDLPSAALAVSVQIDGGVATVHRELESNRHEVVELGLPAVITVQTGINQPRYVSIMGIRKVRRIPIEERDASDLGLDEGGSSCVSEEKLELPTSTGSAEILEGGLDETARRAATIIHEALA